jgi:chemotaxis response regulator CheB
MTKFLLISEDIEKEKIINEVCPSDEIITTTDEVFVFDNLKVEEPDIVIIDGDLQSLDLKSLCRKIKQYPVIILMILGEVQHNKDVTHNANLFHLCAYVFSSFLFRFTPLFFLFPQNNVLTFSHFVI